MLETLTLTTILLTLFFFYQNKRLGLDSAIPKDPNQRMRFYCSECLAQLKLLLPHCQIEALEANAISFRPSRQEKSHRLEQKDGRLWLTQGEPKERVVGELGSHGQVSFERNSESGLVVNVLAQDETASHSASLRLEVSYLS